MKGKTSTKPITYMKERLAMLKLVALGERAVEKGEVKTASKAFEDIEKRRKKRRRL